MLTTQTTAPQTTAPQPSPIDMYTPAQACELLSVDELVLLDMVNTGRLAAYRIGDQIRFRVRDVQAAGATVMLAAS